MDLIRKEDSFVYDAISERCQPYRIHLDEMHDVTGDGTYDGASIVYGCTDSNACNYNSDATNDDGNCEYAQGSCNCNGNPTGNYCDCNYNIDDECGVCDGDGSSCAGSVDVVMYVVVAVAAAVVCFLFACMFPPWGRAVAPALRAQ